MLTFKQYILEASGPNKPTKAELVAARAKQAELKPQGYRGVGHGIPQGKSATKLYGFPKMTDNEFYDRWDKGEFNPHLWFKHHGKPMVMKQYKGGEQGFSMVHSRMPGYWRGRGDARKGPAYQGRVDHQRKAISIANGVNIENARREQWGLGLIRDKVLKKDPTKIALARDLAKKFPGYTVHDTDNDNAPIF